MRMVLDQIKTEVEALSKEDRRQLSAFILQLELVGDEEYIADVRRRSDDKNPENWVPADQI